MTTAAMPTPNIPICFAFPISKDDPGATKHWWEWFTKSVVKLMVSQAFMDGAKAFYRGLPANVNPNTGDDWNAYHYAYVVAARNGYEHVAALGQLVEDNLEHVNPHLDTPLVAGEFFERTIKFESLLNAD